MTAFHDGASSTDPTRNLLTAVLEALDIPHPATIGDTETHDQILADRAMHAAIALRSVLDDKPQMSVEWTTTYLRERLAEHPPTGYRHYGTPRTEAGQ
ncbi:hypothetical protein LRD69_13955 [Streptomyces sp. JH14]|uniref:hypothetical protein n=1 Tax=Streptomyces sp. JH14 TaxID=2793630 RepID=UPI0023F9D4EC|nr:hypothetical protein [Streptomyces sp. JH14]MDF6043232.1 hypothetical protein [Streptomyces sp. JH14]